ncbi:hypothetical protein TCAL_04714 [Tigriopus californicus]|uniref:Uncharacterized protein n=1 Tax=Tigriopus californicus TaxID=6832 RepID=A0A553PRT0_TIGCA|nr:hypothetical protein TCAL_04714 [Tigriopus californicus]|eukprot:TCALIF_04714-PA protein Name:"Protein of unknown function" AED:0.01 eAED:0.01 QI:114/0.83/0.85/1/1/1/7/73/414
MLVLNMGPVLVFSLVLSSTYAGTMLDMLNGMEQVLTGSEEFDPVLYQAIRSCMEKTDPNLVIAQENLWNGMLEYASIGGTLLDPWTPCENDVPPLQRTDYYETYNCSVQDFGGIPIHEPCNYASNIAYYHLMLEILTAIIRASSFLAQGSGMFHASQTILGNILDGNMTDLLGYVAYQAAMAGVQPLDSTIIHDLGHESRPFNAVEVSENVQNTFINDPLLTWGETINSTNIPRLRLTLCGYLGTIMTLVFEDEVVDQIAEYLIDSFDGFSPDLKEFCLQTFLPEIRVVTADFELPEEEKTLLTHRLEGILMKLLYGAIWQEEVFISNEELLTPEANALGATYIPVVNDLANSLLEFVHNNPDFQHGKRVYPGDEWCNPLIPHAKWHLQCGVGLTDLIFLADDLYRIFGQYKGA